MISGFGLIPSRLRALLLRVGMAAMTWGLAHATPSAQPALRGPHDLHDPRPRWDVRWDGGPATARVGSRVVGRNLSSPWRSPRLRPGQVLTLQTPQALHEIPLHHLTSPVDLARWSGPGLRGAWVVDIAPSPRGPWIATAGGGAGWWDGERWHHLDRRHGLPSSTLTAIDIVGGHRWFGSREGLTHLDPDGRSRTLPLPVDQLAADAAGVWVLSDGQVFRITDPTAGLPEPAVTGCASLLTWQGEAVASCPQVVRLPSGRSVPELRGLPDHVIGLVPRADGAWAITASGLHQLVNGRLITDRTPAIVGARDLLRIGDSLLLVDASEALIRIDREGRTHEVTSVHGLPSPRALRLAPGPRERTAWVGTRRGLALVEENGDTIGLPLAPLAVGRGACAVHPTRQGVALLSDDGPVFLGRRPPRNADAFAAAAGPGTVALLHHQDHWLALRDDALFVLRKDGQLRRLPTGSARALDLQAAGEAVAVVLQEGLRAWLPGATVLSAQDGPSYLHGARVHPRLTLVWDHQTLQRLPPVAWTVRAEALDVWSVGTGWWVTTPQGMRALHQDGTWQPLDAPVPPLTSIVPTPTGPWGLTLRGTPQPFQHPGPSIRPTLPDARRLRAWPGGVAVLSDHGATLWRMP